MIIWLALVYQLFAQRQQLYWQTATATLTQEQLDAATAASIKDLQEREEALQKRLLNVSEIL